MPWEEQRAYFVEHWTDFMARSFRGYSIPSKETLLKEHVFLPVKPRESEEEYRARIEDAVRDEMSRRIASGERPREPIA